MKLRYYEVLTDADTAIFDTLRLAWTAYRNARSRSRSTRLREVTIAGGATAIVLAIRGAFDSPHASIIDTRIIASAKCDEDGQVIETVTRRPKGGAA